MFDRLVRTTNDPALTVVRLALGIVFFAHGAQQTLGWFGGGGFSGTMQFFNQQYGIPPVFAFLAIVAQFFGSLGLIVGLLGRVAALGISATMLVAAIHVHLPFGFFINWGGNQKGEGIEFQVLAIAMGLALMIKGSGALSVDSLLSRKAARTGGSWQHDEVGSIRK